MKWLKVLTGVLVVTGLVFGGNYLTNPGFEEWDSDNNVPSGWSAENGVSLGHEDGIVHGGNYSVSIAPTGSSNRGLYQEVSVPAGATSCTTIVWIYGVNGTGYSGVGFYLKFYDADHGYISGTSSKTNQVQGQWEVDTIVADLPTNTAYVRLTIRGYYNGGLAGYADDAYLSFVIPSNNPPVIHCVCRDWISPPYTQSVTVAAYITDDQSVTDDSLYYSIDGGTNWTAVYHSSRSNDTSYYSIPSQNRKTIVDYFVIAKDADGNVVSSDTFSYIVSPLTIDEIQGTGDATPYSGYKAYTYGIVTGVYPKGFFIEERPGGVRKGVWVYTNTTPSVSRGDSVKVLGKMSEYYSLTEIYRPDSIIVIQSDVELPAPITVTLAEFNEDYESVLLKVKNVTVTNSDLGYGEWEISDGNNTGRVDDMGSYTYKPFNGDQIDSIVGPLYYSYGNFKLEPRDDNDIFVNTTTSPHAAPPDSFKVINGNFIVIDTVYAAENVSTDSLFYKRPGDSGFTGVYHDSTTSVTKGNQIFWYTIPYNNPGEYDYYVTLYDANNHSKSTSQTTSQVTSPARIYERDIVTYKFSLKVVPNPVRKDGIIELTIPKTQNVEISLYNVAGRKIMTLYKGRMSAGIHRLPISRKLKTAVYFLQVKTQRNGNHIVKFIVTR